MMQIGSRAFFKWAHFSLAYIVNVHNIHQKKLSGEYEVFIFMEKCFDTEYINIFKTFSHGHCQIDRDKHGESFV